MARTQVRWTAAENTELGKDAAHHVYQGMKELNAFRMAQSKLPSARQRGLASIQQVPESARLICKETLRQLNKEARRITLEDDTVIAVPSGFEQYQQLLAINQSLVQAVHSMHQSLTNRISSLENVILDLLAEQDGKTREVLHIVHEDAPKPKIAVIGLKPEQAHILSRDYPNVDFTFGYDGKFKVDPKLAVYNNAVIITKWTKGNVWSTFQHYSNAHYIAGGMTQIKNQIEAVLQGLI